VGLFLNFLRVKCCPLLKYWKVGPNNFESSFALTELWN
jgi:hypothetical protein